MINKEKFLLFVIIFLLISVSFPAYFIFDKEEDAAFVFPLIIAFLSIFPSIPIWLNLKKRKHSFVLKNPNYSWYCMYAATILICILGLWIYFIASSFEREIPIEYHNDMEEENNHSEIKNEKAGEFTEEKFEPVEKIYPDG